MLTRMSVPTRRREALEDITERIIAIVRNSGIREGLCFIMIPHTTAGVTVNESADPTVVTDVLSYLSDLVPREGGWLHSEGNSDAHVKAAMIGHNVVVPIEAGELVLGTWQGIFIAEFDGPRARWVHVKIMPG